MQTNTPIVRLLVAGIGALVVLLALARLGPGPAEAIFMDADGDGAIDVAEQISGSNPNDSNSVPEDGVIDYLSGTLNCSDFADNDGDGDIDGADNGCADHDGDVVSDGMEIFLGSDPFDDDSFPEDSRFDAVLASLNIQAFACSDNLDNDGDGSIDEADSGCVVFDVDGDDFDDVTEKSFGSDPNDPQSVPEHENPNPGSCSDSIDNDLDTDTDAADLACVSPPNDRRADATVIGAVPYHAGPTVIKNATRESGEPFSNCGLGSPTATVWYTITPVADEVLVVDTIGSTFSNSLSVWQRTGSTLRAITCDGNVTGSSRVVFRAAAGETYFFQIDIPSSFARLPELTLNVTLGSPPANDDFADAMDIGALPFSDSLDKSDATSEFGEPRPNCAYYTGSPSVWYTFTPGSDTLVVADTLGSDVDSVIAVYQQTIFGLVPVECSNDFADSQQSKLAFEALAGKTYYFQVARAPSFFGSSSNFDVTFSVDVGVPPANDDFADASPLSLPFTQDVDLLTAGLETDEPVPGCLYYSIDSSVWFSFTAASNGVVVAEAGDPDGFEFSYSYLGVYQGSSVDSLTPIACGAPTYPQAKLGFVASAGQTYYLQFGGVSTSFFGKSVEAPAGAEAAGSSSDQPITLHVELEPLPACAPVQFSMEDPAGDQRIFGSETTASIPDIRSVAGGSDGDNFCLRVVLDEPFDPPGIGSVHQSSLSVQFDTDRSRQTGYQQYPCGIFGGIDATVRLDGESGQLADISLPFGPPVDAEQYAIAQYVGDTIMLLVPLDVIGGDDEFTFGVGVGRYSYDDRDCAPNVGGLVSPEPAPPGDANCDGEANSLDALLIIQYFAHLTGPLPCQYVADVNENGNVGPLDALQILQYDAGMLGEFVPED